MSEPHPMRAKRKEMGKTQAELAAQVGIATSYISLIESNEREPSLTVAARLSAALDLPIDQFVRRTEAA